MVFRFYVNRKITKKGGGDLSRTFDIEAESREKAEASLKASDHPLAADEEIGEITEVHLVPPMPDPIQMSPEPIPPPGGPPIILPPGAGR